MNKTRWALWGLFALSVLLAGAFFTYLTEPLAVHWNLSGNANGFAPRPWIFLIPAVLAFMAVMHGALPRLDPMRKNYPKFQDAYDRLFLGVSVFLFAVFLHGLAWNLGTKIPLDRALPAALGLFAILLASVLSRVKPNWFVGIRTPWTLSSPTVWEKTHRIAAKLFLAAGIAGIACALLFPPAAIAVGVGSIAAAAVASVAYSYAAFRREEKGRARKKN